MITGGIGALAGVVYGLATGKSGKQILALAAGGFVAGATLGLGTAAVGVAGGAASLATATFSQAAAGAASIGVANAGFITIGTGVVGNMLGEATQQGLDVATGAQAGFDKNDIVLNGVFGLSEVVLGPVADAITQPIKTTLKEGLTESFKTTFKEERTYKNELTKQLMQAAADQGITKKEAARAAEKIISTAKETNQRVLDATVQISNGAVEVIVNTGTTAAGERIEDNN